MTQMTIASVNSSIREYDTQHGLKAAIKVTFEDGTLAELTTNADKGQDRLEALQKLVGQPGDFTLEDQGKFPSGDPKPPRITGYPGKPGKDASGPAAGSKYVPNPERDALQAAVSIAQTAHRVPDGASVERTLVEAEDHAEAMLAFVELAVPRILKAQGSGAAVDSASDSADSLVPSLAAEKGGRTPPVPAEPEGSSTPSGSDGSCEHDWRQKPQGWVRCDKCGAAEQRELTKAG